MPGPDTVTITLSDLACITALRPSFGPTPLGFTSKYDHIVGKINQTPVDRSLGEDKAVRHVVLRVAEAQDLMTAFRDSADAFNEGGRGDLAVVCAAAVANIHHKLRAAGISN